MTDEQIRESLISAGGEEAITDALKASLQTSPLPPTLAIGLKPRNNLKIVLVLIIVFVALAGSVGAYWYFSNNKVHQNAQQSSKGITSPTTNSSPTTENVAVQLPALPANSPQKSAFTFLSPESGEKLIRGVSYKVSWDSSGFRSLRVDLNRASDGKIVTYVIPTVDYGHSEKGSGLWRVPSDLPEGEYYMTATKIDNVSTDIKSPIFKIISSEGVSQKVISPNDGEKWKIRDQNIIVLSPFPIEKWRDIKIYLDKFQNGKFITVGEVIGSADFYNNYYMQDSKLLWDGEVIKRGNFADPGNYYLRVVDTSKNTEVRSASVFQLIDNPVKVDLKINDTDSPFKVSLEGTDVKTSWTSNNVDNCTLYPNPTGSKGTLTNLSSSGEQTVYLKGTIQGYNYWVYMRCSSALGKTMDLVEVFSDAQAPSN